MKRVVPTRFVKKSRPEEEKNASLKDRRFGLIEWFSSSIGSIVLHLAILLLLFLFAHSEGKNGRVGSRNTDEVGIVFSEVTDSSSEKIDEANKATAESSVFSDEANDSETAEDSFHETIENLLPTNEIGLTHNSRSISSQEIIKEAASGGLQGNRHSSDAQSVGFVGAWGSGKKFVYVIDRSDSMGWKGGAPMRRAVSDAVTSVQSLDPKLGATKFQVVVFNHDVDVFGGSAALIDVNPSNKAKCVRFLNSIIPSGGTSPEQALMTGIKMKPDVLFFLTDADEELTDNMLERVRTLRRQCNVRQICVIEFRKSTDPVKQTYKRLAGENGGAYVSKEIDLF